MSRAATAEDGAPQPSPAAAATTRAEPRAFAAPHDAWRRNLEAGAATARAFQAQNADFAGRLLELNLQAARAFGAAAAGDAGYKKPFELGASAVELCFGYLGRSAALAQQAVILPWSDRRTPL
jgi:hypothetical protein